MESQPSFLKSETLPSFAFLSQRTTLKKKIN
jgi:hypothetical protein